MAVHAFDFARLIYPVEQDAFFSDYWEKAPLVVRDRDPNYYTGLLSRTTLDHLIVGFGAIHAGDIRIVKNQQNADLATYLNHDDSLNLNRLYTAYATGHTIVFDHFKQHPPLLALFRNVERVLNHPISATCFLTPPDARTFGAHFDGVDTFILQIEGTKHWKVFDAYAAFPMEQGPVPDKELPPLLHELHLEAGDLIYMPRGFAHEALTTQSSSLSVSMYVNRFTWKDLLSASLDVITAKDARFRKALPPGFLQQPTTPGSLHEQFSTLLDLLRDQASLDEAVDRLGDHFLVEKPPAPDGHFTQLDQVASVEPTTVVGKRQDVICRVVREPRAVTILFSGGRMTGPLKIEPALRFIAATTTFRVSELPDPLSEREKLVLVRRLVREGLLTTATVP